MTEINPLLDSDVMLKIEAWKAVLRDRCHQHRLELPEGKLIHVVLDEHIYVLANAIVGHEALYDEAGLPTGEMVPRYNFQRYWQPQIKVPWREAPEYYKRLYEMWNEQHPDGLRQSEVVIPNPQPYGLDPIMAPWLAVKLDLAGNLVADGAGPQSYEVVGHSRITGPVGREGRLAELEVLTKRYEAALEAIKRADDLETAVNLAYDALDGGE